MRLHKTNREKQLKMIEEMNSSHKKELIYRTGKVLTLGKRNLTSGRDLLSIRRIKIFLVQGVLGVLAKAGLLLIDLNAAGFSWQRRPRERGQARRKLVWVACHCQNRELGLCCQQKH